MRAITYTYTLRNRTASQISGVSLFTTGNGTVTISGNCPSTINMNSQITCSGTRTVTQPEIDLGTSLINTATAYTAGYAVSNSLTTTIGITQIKKISIDSLTAALSALPLIADTTSTINYVYILKNTGNVTLQGPTVSDNQSIITCPGSELPPFIPSNTTITCTGTHTLSQIDLSAGAVTNIGTARATFGGGIIPTSDPASQTVIINTAPGFSVEISANYTSLPAINTFIRYTYTIKNTGGTTLAFPVLSASKLTSGNPILCPSITPLSLQESRNCTSDYKVVDSNPLTNTLTATSAIAPTVTKSLTLGCNLQNLTVSNLESGSNYIKKWTITNNTGADIHISSFSFNWNNVSNGGGNLKEVILAQTWFLKSPDSPLTTGVFSDSFPTPLSIATGATIELSTTFSKQSAVVSALNFVFSEARCSFP